MNLSKLSGDLIVAIAAQGINAITSTLLTLALPKVLGTTDFAYWQLFIFYSGYIGFFHLGLNDGVYLKYGGITRENVDKKEICSQFWLSAAFQAVLSAALFYAALTSSTNEDRKLVLTATIILIVINNSGLFLGYLFQAMGETRLFSMSVTIESIILLGGIIVLIALGVKSYVPFVGLYIVAKLVRLIFCCIKGRDFILTEPSGFKKTLRLSISNTYIGFKLMIANTAGTLILGILRLLVDNNWGIEIFSMVSFALSITTFFMLFVSQVSMVLFPTLRQSSGSDTSTFFETARNALNVLLPGTYLLYFPIVALVSLWLPEYATSFFYFAFVFPLCIFEGKMDVLGTTYLKVYRKESRLLTINLATLFASATISLIGVRLQSVEFMLLGVILALGLRELYTERYIGKLLGKPNSKMSIASIVVSVCFVLSCHFLPGIYSILGVIITLLLYYAFFHKQVSLFVKKISSTRNRKSEEGSSKAC